MSKPTEENTKRIAPSFQKANARILIIEDEEDIAELLRFNLETQGYRVRTALEGESGLQAALEDKPDLILLDLMLPGLNGLEICQRIKSEKPDVPVIIVTAKGGEHDVVKGLETGADDYVTKPFRPKVILARISAVLRRVKSSPRQTPTTALQDDAVRVHKLVIHPGRHVVEVAGTRLDLTPSEFNILLFLARRPGWVFTRGQIVDAVRGENYAVTERSIDVQLVGLRKKLGKFDHYVETVRGVGYRFMES